ncbi:CAP domain-containing protein [Hymenobacter sp.]|jgi:uncharacterized protein YkwD|uniref:CAP domain-containing protein n=1 Tax=Hymenobacter sp. TaxID=1898978 RepID=UPI002EDBA648
MNFFALLLLLLITTGNATAPETPAAIVPAATWTDLSTTPSLLQQLNMYRQRAGLPPLVLSETACRAARLQAVYNLTHRTHGHYNPQYATPLQRLAAVGHEFQRTNGYISYGYENCVRFRGMKARNLTSIEAQIMQAYKHSPKHNAALLDPHPTKVGIATIYDGDELQNSMVFCI